MFIDLQRVKITTAGSPVGPGKILLDGREIPGVVGFTIERNFNKAAGHDGPAVITLKILDVPLRDPAAGQVSS